ncbi:winged helix-turn-helix domain-containing protein [Tardiphaga sp.]|uniref:winged helix-turn-helix domain-containing protein n=1 Tax=Tardiphaga sp. TaxID=1926292 RepID=UPI0037DA15BC
MPRSPTQPIAMDQTHARRVWLRAQRLDERAPFGEGADAVARAVQHLGYVQIDTINVIERSHHHILFARIPNYKRSDLKQAQSIDKSVFEYWTHALAYVPAADLRFFVPDMKYYRANGHDWCATVTPADKRKVMRLAKSGPLSIRDIDDDVLREKDHEWASRKPSKRALQLAFFEGHLTVSERTGMLKTYDLLLRHFDLKSLPKAATGNECFAYLLDRALRSQGIVSLDSICHLDAPSKAGVRKIIEARMKRRELMPVALEGAGKQEHWATPDSIEASETAPHGLVHLLSPFDPLIIQRKRAHLVFGHDHRFEAYVPKDKRKLGYFALPVLVDDKIVAAIDLKTDRQNKKLLMQQWSWVGEGAEKKAPRKEWKRRIEEELHRFEAFQLDP